MKFISETITHLFYKKSQQESDIQKEQVKKGTSFPVLTAIIKCNDRPIVSLQ